MDERLVKMRNYTILKWASDFWVENQLTPGFSLSAAQKIFSPPMKDLSIPELSFLPPLSL